MGGRRVSGRMKRTYVGSHHKLAQGLINPKSVGLGAGSRTIRALFLSFE